MSAAAGPSFVEATTTKTPRPTTEHQEDETPNSATPSGESVATSTITPTTSRVAEYSLSAVALIFCVPAAAGLNFGYDIGATSYAITQLQSETGAGVSWWHVLQQSPVLQGIIVSAASAGALLGSLFIFGWADYLGRKLELQLGALFYLTGAAVQCASGFIATQAGVGITTLLIGRFIYGLGIGVSMHAAPTYLAEMGPSSIRGFLVSLKEAAIVLGILLGYTIGYAFLNVTGGWKWTYACSSITSVFILVMSLWIPPSCRWLLLQGREEEALDSLRFVFFEENAVYEFEEMKRLQQESVSPSAVGGATNGPASIWDPSRRAPLLAGVGLVVLQQVTGQPSVLSYATPIFRNAGLSDYASVLIALFKLMATLLTAITVEKYGRKKLLYAGCTLMLLALTTLSLSFGKTIPGVDSIILLSMFVYIGGYQVGFGPISWLIISEVFPLSVRGQAVALAVQMNFLLNAVVQFGVPVLESAIGLNTTFGIFAFLTIYSLYFVKVHVPETKGLTLEEIEQQFRDMEAERVVAMEEEAAPLLEI